MFWVFFFCLFQLAAEETFTPISHFEGGVLPLIGGSVHAMTGAPVVIETDLVVPGIEPLAFIRRCHYSPLGDFSAKKASWDNLFYQILHQEEVTIPANRGRYIRDGERYSYEEDQQAMLSFRLYKGKEKETAYFNPKGKGAANIAHGYPSGKTALKNISIIKKPRSRYGSDADLMFGNGEIRRFVSVVIPPEPFCQIEEITTPKQYKKQFHRTGIVTLSKVSVTSPAGEETASMEFANSSKAKAPDGRYVFLKYAHEHHQKAADRFLLETVYRSDYPPVAYTYHPNDKNKQLTSILYPNQRGISFGYWEEGDEWIDGNRRTKLSGNSYQAHKIKTIQQPVGASAKRLVTHLIQYFIKESFNGDKAHTRVVSSYGHVDDYFFDENHLMKEVCHYSSPIEVDALEMVSDVSSYQCDQKESFFWTEEGEISLHALYDSRGKICQARRFIYDDRGNVLKEITYGKFTGERSSLPKVIERGEVIVDRCESSVIKRTFSKDGFNLLLSEKNTEGLKTEYTYLQGTDLVTQKTVFANGREVKKEIYGYDEHHCLTSIETLNGPVHLIEKITPSRVIPFGYPIEKKKFAQGVLLESVHYTYNTRGDLLREEKKDANGEIIFFIEKTYDPHGNCLLEKNSLGHEIRRKFDGTDNCVQEEGPRPGLVKKFTYDYMDRCVEEVLSYKGDRWVTRHRYNLLGQRVETIDHAGHATEWVYDRYGRVLETHLPSTEVDARPIIRRKFDIFGHEIATIDPLGHRTTRQFTNTHQPYRIVHPDGGEERAIYSVTGRKLKNIDPDGVVTEYAYDPLGHMVKKTTPHGTLAWRYEGDYLMAQVDEEGVETSFTYDVFGRQIEKRRGRHRECIAYDRLGHPYRLSHYEEDKLLSTEVSFVDPLGRVVEKYLEDPDGTHFNHERFVYDEVGNCIEQWRGKSCLKRTFDGKNRITSVLDDQGHLHRVIYDDLKQEKWVIDPLGGQVITHYDPQGRAIVVVHLTPFGQEIKRHETTYDLAGRIVKEETIAQGETRTVLKDLDSRGRVTLQTEPLGKITRMQYSLAGNLLTLTKPDGLKLVHTYSEGRLIQLSSSDGSLSYHYSYNQRGELVQVDDEMAGTSSYQTFSPLGELLEEVLPTGQAIRYTYDALGRMTSYSLPDGGKVLLSYNARAVTSISRLDREEKVLYTHVYTAFDEVGNVLEQKHLGEAGVTRFTYDSLYQITGLDHSHWEEDEFSYDAVGNLLSFRQNHTFRSFAYDDLYQLTEEDHHAYTMDPFYNRRSKDGDPYAVNALNQLLATRDASFIYDANGNCIRWESGEELLLFSYDALNRLTAIQKGEERVVFTYDPFHRRLTRNNEPFYFFREQEIGFRNDLRILGPGLGGDIGAAIALELEGSLYSPLHDFRGNIVGLISPAGLLSASWNYTAYGELLGTCLSPWGFASKRTESLTGWLSFGRRDYDPVTGRWTTPDPLGFDGGLNLYTYLTNRPLLHRDPLGLLDDANPDFYTFAEQSSGIWQDCFSFISDICLSCIDFFCGHASERDKDQGYPCESYLADRYCNWSTLHEQKSARYQMNGLRTSPKIFESNYDYAHDLRPDMPILARYNPSHGEGFVNAFKDFLRACRSILGMEREDLTQAIHGDWNRIFSATSSDFHLLLEPHSEGNIVLLNALKTYNTEYRQRISCLGLCPAKYGLPDSCGQYTCLTTSTDCVAWVDTFGRSRVDATNAWVIRSDVMLDHDLKSDTLRPYWKKGVDSFYETGKISFK